MGEHRCAGIPPTASVWLRVSALLSISLPTIVVLLVSHSTTTIVFLLHFLHLSVLPVLFRTPSPPQNPVELARSRVLPFTSIYPLLPIVYHCPVLPFDPLLPMFVPHFPSQNPVEPTRSLLQRAFFSFPFSSLPYFPVLWILPWLCWFYLYCVCNVFFFPLCFARVFLKIVFMIDVCFFSWFGSRLSNVVDFAFNLLHQLSLFAFFSTMRFSPPLFPRIFLINLFVLD